MNLYATRWGRYDASGQLQSKWHLCDEDADKDDGVETLCGQEVEMSVEGGTCPPQSDSDVNIANCPHCLKALRQATRPKRRSRRYEGIPRETDEWCLIEGAGDDWSGHDEMLQIVEE